MGLPAEDRLTVSKEPHGWIQWKGTSICMDVHCECGNFTHIDADFAYFIRCPECGRVYRVDQTVKLLELSKEETAKLDSGQICDCD